MTPSSSAPGESARARLAQALKEHHARLNEILDALERRDMSPSQVREHLGWVAEGLKDLRKQAKSLEG